MDAYRLQGVVHAGPVGAVFSYTLVGDSEHLCRRAVLKYNLAHGLQTRFLMATRLHRNVDPDHLPPEWPPE